MRGALTATTLLLVGTTAAVGSLRLGFGAWVWLTIVSAVTVGLALSALVLRADPPSWNRRALLLVATAGVIARIALMSADYYLSDDAFRYHWDGKVLAHGLNPYRHAPIAEDVAHLRTDPIDRLINHPDVVTVYPPLAEGAFALGYLLTPGSLHGYNVVCLLSEMLAWILLAIELRRRRRGPLPLVLLVLFPLPIFEGYLPGHTEPLVLPILAALIMTVSRGWVQRTGVVLGLACLIKPLALLFLPAVLTSIRSPQRWRLFPALAATILIPYLPFLGAGDNLTSSMLLMARKWSFNGSIAALLAEWIDDRTLRPILIAGVGLIAIAGARLGRSFAARSLIAFTGLVALTPTLYPWYAIWSLPFLVMHRDASLILLAALLPVSEVVVIEYYTRGLWLDPLWPRLLIYLPFYGVLLASVAKRRGMFSEVG